jgi:hypothetical protein
LPAGNFPSGRFRCETLLDLTVAGGVKRLAGKNAYVRENKEKKNYRGL